MGGNFLVKIQLRQRSIAGYVTAPRLDFSKKVPDLTQLSFPVNFIG